MTGTLEAVRRLSHGPLLSDQAVVSPSGQAALAGAYLNLPELDESAVPAWQAMALEVERQAELLESIGFTFGSHGSDPYLTAQDMFRAVETDRHISVLPTSVTGSHPIWTDAENDLFRAVHDVFGHFASQRGFDRHGEEAAYRRHALMFSPLAQLAMATETRGQNAALIAAGSFQSERIAILPSVWRSPYALVPTGPEEYREIAAHRAQIGA